MLSETDMAIKEMLTEEGPGKFFEQVAEGPEMLELLIEKLYDPDWFEKKMTREGNPTHEDKITLGRASISRTDLFMRLKQLIQEETRDDNKTAGRLSAFIININTLFVLLHGSPDTIAIAKVSINKLYENVQITEQGPNKDNYRRKRITKGVMILLVLSKIAPIIALPNTAGLEYLEDLFSYNY